MYTSVLITAFALLPSALAIPSRLPAQYGRRAENGTQNFKPACDMAGVVQPASTLSAPTGLNLILVAMGEGTQNYTCGTNLTAPPTAIGAVAQLFDDSCAITQGSGASTAQYFGMVEESAKSIGAHFFVDNTTPDFDISGLGNTQLKKSEDCNAPNPTADVKWLRLQAKGGSSNVKEIYRLNTSGGMAPVNCEGKTAGEVVTVPYKAQYWVYTMPETQPQRNETPASIPGTNPQRNETAALPAPVSPSSAPVQAFEGAAAHTSPLSSLFCIVSLVSTYLFLSS